MPVVCFRQGDVFRMEVDYAGLALQLNRDSVLLWLQNTSSSLRKTPTIAEEDPSCSVPSPSSLDEPAIPAQCQRLLPSAHTRPVCLRMRHGEVNSARRSISHQDSTSIAYVLLSKIYSTSLIVCLML
ncbi:uncharacterized protein LOC112326671 [Populus trichocarpa]|uniref:Uncharacterized protein n=1 Tax=Populus trichocarpa TaxID=3694 RepID=A0A3N7ET26_POPTR|nr:uncharacterized protein LOC112326671 [Populus trichocarpa]KAI5599482.1 hypothetical protein BDE02_02G198300 [Populus trichocarpa]|eukprot:XP_024451949.1 uncharacterized protein LOC112326671 isoform X1 [Populus trichocarpa]